MTEKWRSLWDAAMTEVRRDWDKPGFDRDDLTRGLVQQERDDVYEKCIRKLAQKIAETDRAAQHGKSRVLTEVMLSIKSMRHSEHKADPRYTKDE